MHKLKSVLMPTAVLAAILVAGCGGGGSSGAAVDPATEAGQSVEKTINFIKDMMANNDENSDPIDVNSLTLAVDDSADATAL